MADIRKSFYHTRVQMYFDALTSLPEQCVIVFIPRQGLYILKTLMRYAHRRINWVQEILNEQDFLAPNDANWDTIQAIVDETEGCLMATCDISQIVSALQCICNSLKQVLGTNVAPYVTMKDETVESVFEYNSTIPDHDFTGITDENACKTAQLYYALGFETITEIVLPASRFAFDTLVPAVAALIVTVTGGLALPAAIGVYLTVELIQELFEMGYRASESNLENWLISVKEEVVCTAYFGLLAELPASAVAQMVYDDVIAPSSSISYGDKLIAKLFFSAWTLKNAEIARQQNTPWAQENIIPGYCAICEFPGDYVYLFPPCPNTWVGAGVECCAENNIVLAQMFSNWYCNNGAPFAFPILGHYNVTYRCWLYVDFSKWNFPPDADDRLILLSVRNSSTSGIDSQFEIKAGEVSSPGWNYLYRIDQDADFAQVGQREMVCCHQDTNARCTGIRISALSVSFTLLE